MAKTNKTTKEEVAKEEVKEIITPTKEVATEVIIKEIPEQTEEITPLPTIPAQTEKAKTVLPHQLAGTKGFSQTFLEILAQKNTGGCMKANDILKSLYPPVVNNLPQHWQEQGVMKTLRGELQILVDLGKIEIVNNSHRQLGRVYFNTDDVEQRSRYYHLGDVDIHVKLL